MSRCVAEGAGLAKTLIGASLLPPLPLTAQTAHLPKLSIANAELGRVLSDIQAPGTSTPRFTAQIDDITMSTAIRKLEIVVPTEAEMAYSGVFSLCSFYAKQLGKKFLSLTNESLVAQALFNTVTFGAAQNAAVSYTTGNLATISLISDIIRGLEKVRSNGEEPNAVVIPSIVWELCAQSPKVAQFVVGTINAISDVTTTLLEAALKRIGYDVTVYIGRAMYNNGAKGVKSLNYIWSSDYIWVGTAGADNKSTSDDGIPNIEGVGATPYWANYGLYIGDGYLDNDIESWVVRGKMSGNPTILNSAAGTLIATNYNLDA